MKNILFPLVTLVALLFIRCSRESELEKSYFISDSVDANLPAYSEWGYNTFGAYLDRQVFISNDQVTPAKVITDSTKSLFMLKGQLGPNYGYYYGYSSSYSPEQAVSVTFVLHGLVLSNYSELANLNDTMIDLSQKKVQIMLATYSETDTVPVLNGSLYIKKVQRLFVDDLQVEVILSGTFSFQMIYHGEPVSMSDGRFDVGIDEKNFFRL